MKARIVNDRGLHGRPASTFAQLARTFGAEITVSGVNGKSMADLLTLGAAEGDEVEILSDDAGAVSVLADLVRRGFGEPIIGEGLS